MAKKLPVISGKQAGTESIYKGWLASGQETRQPCHHEERGTPVTLSNPLHDELRKGLLRDLIKDAELELEEFLSYLIILGS